MTLFYRHHERVQSPAQANSVIHEMFGGGEQKKEKPLEMSQNR
jgi:hypothetical protein